MDDLAAHQAELLAVIQHGVQVLYPRRVSRAVQDDPLPLLGGGGGHVAEGGGQHPVTPLVGRRVKAAVQLRHRDRLRVDNRRNNLELLEIAVKLT